LYLLTAPDIPFEQDGIRDGEMLRDWMHERFENELKKRGASYKVLSGPHNHRFEVATDAIDGLLAKNDETI
jgi:nicotinamide riboside kinase